MARDMVDGNYVEAAIRRLGHYRAVRAQELAEQDGIPGSYLLALGLRETGLKNIRGGGTLAGNTWTPATAPINQDDALHMMPAVKAGTWGPVVKGKNAADPGFVPRYTDSLRFTLAHMQAAMTYGAENGVRERDLLRFAVAAHNAGAGGALKGYKEGNVDKYTTHGDYSAWVLQARGRVVQFLNNNPDWIYEP
jgi:hypothetical protein